MLEILIWDSLIRTTIEVERSLSPTFALHAKNLNFVSKQPGTLQCSLKEPDDTRNIQTMLLSMIDSSLPATAGQKLSVLVKTCLMALEGVFGKLSFDLKASRVEQGINYITTMKTSLSRMHI